MVYWSLVPVALVISELCPPLRIGEGFFLNKKAPLEEGLRELFVDIGSVTANPRVTASRTHDYNEVFDVVHLG